NHGGTFLQALDVRTGAQLWARTTEETFGRSFDGNFVELVGTSAGRATLFGDESVGIETVSGTRRWRSEYRHGVSVYSRALDDAAQVADADGVTYFCGWPPGRSSDRDFQMIALDEDGSS